MKKSLKKKTLGITSSLLMATGIGLTATSCNTPTLDSLFFTVKNGKNLEVTFCDVGASIYSIKYKDQYITYHPVDKATFIKPNLYYGKALGRIAGRIKDGKLSVKGTEYQLEVNEKKNDTETPCIKNNSLHGGTHSLTSQTFKRTVQDLADSYKISFNYVSQDGEAGYPGVVDAWFIYTIYKNEDAMDIDIHATTPYGETPVNLSTHPYFRLGNSGDILSHTLKMNAPYVGVYEEDGSQIVKDKKAVTTEGGAPWNFVNGKAIGKDIAEAKSTDPASGGYDHIWIFANEATHWIELKNPETKINLKVTTDANAVIMYSNCYPNKNIHFNSGEDKLYAAITIEPYTFFDKTGTDSLNITPTKPFNRNIKYTFSTEE